MKKVLLTLCVSLLCCAPCFAGSFGPYVHVTKPNTQYSIDISGSGNVDFFIRPNSIGQQYVYSISTANNGTISYVGTSSNGNEIDDSYNTWSQKAVIGSNTVYEGRNFSWSYDENVIITGPTPFSSDTSNADIYAQYVGFVEDNPYPRPGTSDPNYPGNTPGPNDRLSSFTLPRGNVAYFKVTVASDVNMISHMPTLNNLVQFGNNTLGPWGDTGQRWGYASALPDSSTTFPLGSQVPLTWTKDSSQNILGQTKIGHATKACTTGQWYVFFNPGVSGMSANGLNDIAGASVDLSGYFSEVKVFPLSERLDYSNPLGGTFESYSDDGYASYYDGTINENGTVTWENQDGQISTPQIGGQNAQYGDLSTEGLIKRVQEYLANILNEIKSLFTFGYEAIRSLVDIMSDFVNVFQGLYSWLPQPVHAALVSAVSVAVVIGVFKVFL